MVTTALHLLALTSALLPHVVAQAADGLPIFSLMPDALSTSVAVFSYSHPPLPNTLSNAPSAVSTAGPATITTTVQYAPSAYSVAPSNGTATTSDTSGPIRSNSPAAASVVPLVSSSNGTCGGLLGWTCHGAHFGGCCSPAGQCGEGPNECGGGCQPEYGSYCAHIGDTFPQLGGCLNRANLTYADKLSPDYAQLSRPYNLRLIHKPAVIVLPRTKEDISAAVSCAAANGFKVQARGGGHSYASYSTGGQDGSVVIDLENFQSVKVYNDGVAVAGGGVRVGNLAYELYQQGKRAVPHGTCPGVGIGGHFTHGGYGYNSRAWGLALDSVIGMDVVLANGTIAFASRGQHQDLFWALRGAAESIGIVATFYLETVEAPTKILDFSFNVPGMYNSTDAAIHAFAHIQDFAQNASVMDSGLSFGFYMDGTVFTVRGSYMGDEYHFYSVIHPELVRGLPFPIDNDFHENDWITSLTNWGGVGSLTQPTKGYDAHDNFFAKSVTIPESTPLTTAALESYFSYLINNGTHAPVNWFSIINLYGGPGSLINTMNTTKDAAYPDRDSLWVVQHYGFVNNMTLFPDAGLNFVNGLNTAMTQAMPDAKFGAYLNYVDPSLSAEDAHRLYYGDEIYGRLQFIKEAYDPKNIFWNPQAVTIA